MTTILTMIVLTAFMPRILRRVTGHRLHFPVLPFLAAVAFAFLFKYLQTRDYRAGNH